MIKAVAPFCNEEQSISFIVLELCRFEPWRQILWSLFVLLTKIHTFYLKACFLSTRIVLYPEPNVEGYITFICIILHYKFNVIVTVFESIEKSCGISQDMPVNNMTSVHNFINLSQGVFHSFLRTSIKSKSRMSYRALEEATMNYWEHTPKIQFYISLRLSSMKIN